MPITKYHKNGFSLLEALVALFLLTMGIIPALLVATASSRSSDTIKNSLIGSQLAQEGAEIVRALRDADWFAGDAFGTRVTAGDWEVSWDDDALFPATGQALLINTAGIYSYTEGDETPFVRTLNISSQGVGQFLVQSEVVWEERGRTRSVVVESHIYDWY
ncbi:MAG: prepilin-type N-terminal cleavage/methylation domain-containing protein [Patescibacteria group bacterium]